MRNGKTGKLEVYGEFIFGLLGLLRFHLETEVALRLTIAKDTR